MGLSTLHNLDQMWMEWTIPIQKIEVNKIQVGQLQKTMKPLTPLSYADGPIVFQNLNILLPPLPVKEYDPSTGRLILNLSESSATASKLSALQDSFLQSVYQNQRQWFPESNRSKEQIQAFFQSFVESSCLHLYCPLQAQEKRHTIFLWKDNQWKRLSTTGLLEKGDFIRVALRLQGISYQIDTATGCWTGRFRIQHKIMCIYNAVRPKVVEERRY